jgi:hypothetical protein
MNESLPAAPSLVDMDKLGAELQVPGEVAKFAPKFRATPTLSQTAGDLRKLVSDLQRAHEEYGRQIKQFADEILRVIG